MTVDVCGKRKKCKMFGGVGQVGPACTGEWSGEGSWDSRAGPGPWNGPARRALP